MCCRIGQLRVVPGSRVTRAWPTKCCCEHTHVCCREIRVAPRDRNFTRAWPTNCCCCEHTHVGCRKNHLRPAPKDQGCKGSPDQMLLRAHTCALQNKSDQGCTQGLKCYKGPADRALLQACTCVLQTTKTQDFTQGSTVAKVWPNTCCCGHTHVCCRINHRRVATRVKLYEGFSDQTLHGAYTCVLQNRRIQGCTQG